MGIKVTSKGSWDKTERYLKKNQKLDIPALLEKFGRAGMNALASATPMESGVSAGSWDYEIESEDGYAQIAWYNRNTVDGGAPVVILLQYGHGTGTGGYIQGRDFINPAISPIFDRIDEAVWKAVTSA